MVNTHPDEELSQYATNQMLSNIELQRLDIDILVARVDLHREELDALKQDVVILTKRADAQDRTVAIVSNERGMVTDDVAKLKPTVKFLYEDSLDTFQRLQALERPGRIRRTMQRIRWPRFPWRLRIERWSL